VGAVGLGTSGRGGSGLRVGGVGAVGLGASGRVGSGLRVGGVGLGANGRGVGGVGLGASGCVSAAAAGESALRAVAVSHMPCGHCRQFLQEIRTAAGIQPCRAKFGDLCRFAASLCRCAPVFVFL
jgi:hypothetical protein